MLQYNLPLVVQWAKDRNLIKGSTPIAQMVKLVEEVGELASGVAKGKREEMADSIGDIMVVLTIICEQLHIDLQEAYRMAYLEIKDRKGTMVDGIFVKEEE